MDPLQKKTAESLNHGNRGNIERRERKKTNAFRAIIVRETERKEESQHTLCTNMKNKGWGKVSSRRKAIE